jgi:hypothetical protein
MLEMIFKCFALFTKNYRKLGRGIRISNVLASIQIKKYVEE